MSPLRYFECYWVRSDLWMVDPQWREKLVREIRRKLIHLTGISVPISILILGKAPTAKLITIALIFAIILEYVRLNGQINLPEVRDQERNKVAGYFYYIIGSLLTVIFFQPMIAITAMLNLCLGDTISGIVGSVLDRSNVRANCERINVKPFPIVVCMFLSCLVIGYFSSKVTLLPFEVYLAGAVGATVADSVAINFNGKGFDDNLTIPLFSGVLMSLVLWLS